MREYLTIKTLQIFLWAALAILIFIKIYYYSKIKHDKSVKQFLFDYFIWTPETVRDNMGANKARRKYIAVNNVCMIILWLILLLQIILPFFEEKHHLHA